MIVLAALLLAANAGASETRSAGPVGEPSGVACLPGGNLLVVGDDGVVAELTTGGTEVRSARFAENLEDVAWHVASSRLVVVSERRSDLVVLGRELQVLARVALDAEALLGQPGDRKGAGFEGLAFLPGGELLLVHQRSPAMIVRVAFDPAHPPARLGAGDVRGRWTFTKTGDVTAATWSSRARAVLVLADARDRLLTLAADGSVVSEQAIPGVQQEGLCEDASGGLWIADDQGRTLHHLPGGVGSLR